MAKAVKVRAVKMVKDRAKALHQKETTLKAMAKARVKVNPLEDYNMDDHGGWGEASEEAKAMAKSDSKIRLRKPPRKLQPRLGVCVRFNP